MNQKLDTLLNHPWQTMWSLRKTALMGLGAGVLLGVIAVSVLPKQYKARMTVSPAASTGGADLSAFVPQADTPALQYFLQRVNAVTAADFSAYEALMTGARVASSLQKDESLAPHLSSLCNDCENDSAKLSEWLKNNVRVRAVGNTRLRHITLQGHDKIFLTDMLRAIHRLSDETIRIDQRLRTDQRIGYLREAISNTPNPDHRDALVGLLKEQERIRMMVGIDYDFAASAIDPPVLSPRPVFPNPYVILPLFALLGAAIGAFVGWLRK